MRLLDFSPLPWLTAIAAATATYLWLTQRAKRRTWRASDQLRNDRPAVTVRYSTTWGTSTTTNAGFLTQDEVDRIEHWAHASHIEPRRLCPVVPIEQLRREREQRTRDDAA